MCTSFTLKTQDNLSLLTRTMDFAFILNPDLVVIPRNYHLKSHLNSDSFQVKYAFTGLARNLGEYVFADGVNEKGLACASLYFPKYAEYNKDQSSTAVNLAPHEVVSYLLSHFSSIEEVKENITKINIVDSLLDLLGIVVPLHWIVSDCSGNSIVIEPMKDGIVVHDNHIGVMTNAPDFQWHMTNIRNYIGVSYNPLKPITLEGIEFSPFGQGSGTIGMPGDYTPPSRFMRALFGKETIEEVIGEENAVTAAFHVLSSVNIPKGSVKAELGPDYTQYTASMICTTSSYYFNTYENNQINEFHLLECDLDAKEPLIIPIPKEQNFNKLI